MRSCPSWERRMAIQSHFLKSIRLLTAALAICSSLVRVAGAEERSPKSLTIGVAQLALEATLATNRDKIAAFIRQAKDRGCRVVVFPETSLYWPLGTPKDEIDAAVESLRKTVDENDLYALIGGLYQRDGKEKPF